jgi:hypothetical protein
MGVPYTFATATGSLPLSQLDANFAVATGPNSTTQLATLGQTVFTVPFYYPGTNSLKVYIDGVKQIAGSSYTETNSTTVTFSEGLHQNAVVEFTG